MGGATPPTSLHFQGYRVFPISYSMVSRGSAPAVKRPERESRLRMGGVTPPTSLRLHVVHRNNFSFLVYESGVRRNRVGRDQRLFKTTIPEKSRKEK